MARVASTNSTVLICGETGTGKELVARAIHRNSQRAHKPFIAINCAAVTELFWRANCSATSGAPLPVPIARSGLFEAAHEGTLFLDEVAEMSAAAQAKLLRVLASGEIQRVGSTVTRKVDVRVLAATHRDLQDRIREGLFREDLYYRLAVVPVQLPPLRARGDDLDDLCATLCLRIAEDMKVPSRPISAGALSKLKTYAFPGNIRELRNLLERALILGQHSRAAARGLSFADLDRAGPSAEAELEVEQLASMLPKRIDLRDVMARFERSLLERALEMTNGVQAEAARHLEISRSDLGYRVTKYALSGSRERTPIEAIGTPVRWPASTLAHG